MLWQQHLSGLLPGPIIFRGCVCFALLVCFQVVFEMSGPGERPAATLKRAAEDLLGEGAAGPRRQLPLVPVCCEAVCVIT